METEQAFWEQLRQVIREELAAALQIKAAELSTPGAKTTTEDWIDIKALCLQLKLSRQTVYNWYKNKNVNWLLAPCRKKLGGKVLYDIGKIKLAIRTHPDFFSGGRDYNFKDEAILNDEQKLEKRFWNIKALLRFKEPVSDEDRKWYEREHKRREREEAARFRR